MTRRHHNHMTLKQASARGLTLSQWCAHEQAEEALDLIEQRRMASIIYVLMGLLGAIAVLALLALDWTSYRLDYVQGGSYHTGDYAMSRADCETLRRQYPASLVPTCVTE